MPNYKLYNMCMVYNKENNQVLVQDKVADDGWGGITFPGGHIEFGESFIESTIREVKEETGLDVTDLEYAGIINYYNTDNSERWMCFLYKTNKYSGEVLKETEEGKVFWVNSDELLTMNLAPNMDKYLQLFFSDIHHEAFAKWNSNHTDKLRII